MTLYRDGKPEEFFVDHAFVDGADRGAETWAAVYEAALNQYRTGWNGVNGGYGDEAMRILTGRDASRSWQNVDDIRTALGKGRGRARLAVKKDDVVDRITLHESEVETLSGGATIRLCRIENLPSGGGHSTLTLELSLENEVGERGD